jgi:hypothetical protein
VIATPRSVRERTSSANARSPRSLALVLCVGWVLARSSLLLAFALVACGDNTSGIDAGFVEGPHQSAPQVVMNGGPILAAPEIVPIFFAGDSDMQGQVEVFLQALAASSYWTAVVGEYGVAAPTVMPTIVSTETPPTTDDALRGLLESYFAPPPIFELTTQPPDGWPRPNANTVYVVFLPAGVTLSAGTSVSCRDFGAYHDETADARIVYALVPRCPTMHAPIDAITPALSHELIEAATDPHPQSKPGWIGVDDIDAVWDFTPGPELGDMCEYIAAAYQRLVGEHVVQRTWSNASAAAGHDPCVPTLGTAYVAAAPALDVITFAFPGGGSTKTRGIAVPNGESRTVDVQLFSDATTVDWAIVAQDVASVVQHLPAELEVSLDKPLGNNGDTLRLTIKRLKDGDGGGSEFVVRSRVNGTTNSLWWGLATN